MQFLRTLEIKTEVKVDWLLEKIKANRDRHVKGYEEARVGYIEKAQEKLAARMEQLKNGKLVGLSFDLSVPRPHTTEYDTVIGMLKDTEAKTVVLSAAEYRMLVEDEWDWMRNFLVENAVYSPLLSTRALEIGLPV